MKSAKQKWGEYKIAKYFLNKSNILTFGQGQNLLSVSNRYLHGVKLSVVWFSISSSSESFYRPITYNCVVREVLSICTNSNTWYLRDKTANVWLRKHFCFFKLLLRWRRITLWSWHENRDGQSGVQFVTSICSISPEVPGFSPLFCCLSKFSWWYICIPISLSSVVLYSTSQLKYIPWTMKEFLGPENGLSWNITHTETALYYRQSLRKHI